MPPDLVKLMISEVNVAVPAGPGVEAGMVVLAEVEEPRRRLRIVIAQPEARAIQGAWTGVIPARPSTWDLFVSAVALLEGRIYRVVITSVLEDRHFFANLELERDGVRQTLSCRPSDAVAVALRAYGAEIYAARDVVDAVGLAEDGTSYGPYLKPEELSPVEELSPESLWLTAEAGLAEPGPTPPKEVPAEREAPTRTRSGRLPRKASPRAAGRGAEAPRNRPRRTVTETEGTTSEAGAPVTKTGAPVRKAGTPVQKAGVPVKKAGAPVRKRTPPPGDGNSPGFGS